VEGSQVIGGGTKYTFPCTSTKVHSLWIIC